MAKHSYRDRNFLQELWSYLTDPIQYGLGIDNPDDDPYLLNAVESLIRYDARTEGTALDNTLADLRNAGIGEGIPDAELRAILSDYATENKSQSGWNKFWEGTEYSYDTDEFTRELNEMLSALDERPKMPDSEAYLRAAEKRAYENRDTALSELDALRTQRVGMFNDELASLASGYNTARSGILSQQYQQNAQLMDTMTSQMDRTRRNALEAGASAGLRLAGNINTLLSTQNRQSQQSLETANQLAQMMVNQRNAEAAVRGQYGNYLAQDFSERQNVRQNAEANVNTYYDREYGAAKESYNSAQADWDSKYADNRLWDHASTLDKYRTKYNKTGG